ncbi:uncharacterized protein (DUF362 family) [Methanolinea mesophila]|uniref:DUF362 domain-containing protein n=1 Tax=Methanolinea mesophila TaxID=547055 RepID=UPI001AE0F704|nr:DUF362 domain-containing protein [Methanolinea mesophila]MBP1928851.1 uncharacterized protein (DUF362 family) [Methanolinea mesophila]
MSKVYLIQTSDRAEGIRALFREPVVPDLKGKPVVIKANYNSDDPFPASTHPETLRVLVEELGAREPAKMTLLERSGMGNTRQVLTNRKVFATMDRPGCEAVVLDELPREAWVEFPPGNTHWKHGFYLPKLLLDAGVVVNTCCCKTHRFGGHFTMSLKNSVGLVAKRLPGGLHNYMWELHASRDQRRMIGEINAHYRADLVVMDALEAFVRGGPEQGERVAPGLLLASTDRVAVDAVGVSLLRFYGTTREVTKGSVFSQEQIETAAGLGVGAASSDEVEIVPLNESAGETAEKIRGILAG